VNVELRGACGGYERSHAYRHRGLDVNMWEKTNMLLGVQLPIVAMTPTG